MNISAILIAYYGDKWLPNCVKSLNRSSVNQIHLVLVDNAGNNLINQLDLSAFETEIVKTSYPLGFAKANNFALVNAGHLKDIVLFLNQDTISPDGWIDSCIETFNKYPGLGAVSPLIRNYNDDDWDSSFLNCLSEEQQESLKAGDLSDEVIYANNAPAPALLVRTDVLRAIGPFDPIYGSYYEDYDLCRRIRQHGYQIGFSTSARIRHFSGGSTRTTEQERKRMRQVIRNRILYELRENNSVRWYEAMKRFLYDFPVRLLRGLINTPSSQPPKITLQAYTDLLRISKRVFSKKYDNIAWQRYLDDLGWHIIKS